MTPNPHVVDPSQPADARAPRPATRRSTRFRPNLLLLFALIGVTSVGAFTVLDGSGLSDEEIGERSVKPIVLVVLLILGLSYGVFRMLGRSNRAGNIAMISLTVLVGIGAWALQGHVAELRATGRTLSALEASGAEMKRDALRQLDEQGYAEFDRDRFTAHNARFRDAAEGLSGEHAVMLRAAADYNLRDLGLIEERQAALDEFLRVQGIDWTTVRGAEDLNGRLGALDAYERAHSELVASITRAPDDLEREFAALNISAESRSGFIRGFRNGGHTTLLEANRHEALAIAEMRVMLSLLKNRLGSWRVTEASDLPVFDRPEDTGAFEASWNAFIAANEQAEALQRQLFTR